MSQMQATQVSEERRVVLSQIGVYLGIGLILVLFAVIIWQMGLLFQVPTPETADISRVVFTAKDMAFSPTELRVKAGESVTLELGNGDLIAHSFNIDEFDVHMAIPGNARLTADFTPTEAGTYAIYCRVPGHREAGMVSTLIVEP